MFLWQTGKLAKSCVNITMVFMMAIITVFKVALFMCLMNWVRMELLFPPALSDLLSSSSSSPEGTYCYTEYIEHIENILRIYWTWIPPSSWAKGRTHRHTCVGSLGPGTWITIIHIISRSLMVILVMIMALAAATTAMQCLVCCTWL